ncbi:MAG TPA: hypothetical protein VLZ03_02990 [Thermodesulfobacteriota bacterium]|nr:hypothetical protein [Thermodesulfobacteriota bacterium]
MKIWALTVCFLLILVTSAISQSNFDGDKEKKESAEACCEKIFVGIVGKTFVANAHSKLKFKERPENSSDTTLLEFTLKKPEKFVVVRYIEDYTNFFQGYEVKFESGKVAFAYLIDIGELSNAPDVWSMAEKCN